MKAKFSRALAAVLCLLMLVTLVPMTAFAAEYEQTLTTASKKGSQLAPGVKETEVVAYDKNGNIMGYIDKDGNVIDPGGNIIGKVQPDGSIVDANGNVIGQAATIPGRRLVYDKDGNVIGYVDEDGNVRDANGNIIGRVLPDGTVVDKDGNVIGKVADMNIGAQRRLAYDKDAMSSATSMKTAMWSILTATLSARCWKTAHWLTWTAMLSAKPVNW